MRWKNIIPLECIAQETFSRNSVFVQYKNCFSRRSTFPLSHCIETAWEKAILKATQSNHCVPYDAPKFRLARVDFEENKIFLNIGLTSYKSYIAYRTDVNIRRLTRSIAKNMKIPVHQFLPNVIGNVAIVQTTDGHVVVIKRSPNVSTYKNYLDLPGGHPEPSNIKALANNNGRNIERQIHNELFDSIRQEVQEELEVPISFLGQPKFLTILVNLCDIMTPDIVFLLQVDLKAQEVQDEFLKKKNHKREIKKVLLYDLKNLNPKELKKNTPILEGAFTVLKSINGL